MEITVPKFDDMRFDERTHIYKVGAEELPSVTTLMKPLSESIYGTIDPAVLNKAANRGTAVHNAIENFLRYRIEDIPEEFKGYFEGFKAFEKEYNPKVISPEMQMYHKIYRYAGTADLLCEINGEKVLIDYKTTSKINEMLVSVQLEAYAKALGSWGVEVNKKGVLHLKNDGTFTFKTYEANDSKRWAVFTSLITVWQYIKEYRR